MKMHFRILAMIVTAALLCAVKAKDSFSQNAPSSPAEAGVVLTKLSPPVYPPLARQARIMGDVVVNLQIRPDGGVESAEVVSGHPMLNQAALESAKKSAFTCQNCKETVPYALTYTFGMREDATAGCTGGGSYVRAAKCFYLWRCKWKDAPATSPAIGWSTGRVIVLGVPACVEP